MTDKDREKEIRKAISRSIHTGLSKRENVNRVYDAIVPFLLPVDTKKC